MPSSPPGFRHRWRVRNGRISEGNGLFKVSVGSRGGPSLTALDDLLTEMVEYPAMEALQAAHNVEPVPLP